VKARALVSVVVAAMLVVGVTTEALGAAKVEVSIKAKPAKIKGKVSSSKEDCKVGADVILHWKDGPGGFEPVAEDETNSRGRYSIDAPGDEVPPGRYYSVVDGKQGCKSAQSETIRVTYPG
jgi:hypothetical protein